MHTNADVILSHSIAYLQPVKQPLMLVYYLVNHVTKEFRVTSLLIYIVGQWLISLLLIYHPYILVKNVYKLLTMYSGYVLFLVVNDFFFVTSDILLQNPVTGIDMFITIFADGIAGEPPETFTITSRPPGVISPSDPLFLFRNTTVTIIDADSEPVIYYDIVAIKINDNCF